MPQILSNFVRHYLLALQFFSRIPVTGRLAEWVGFSPVMLRASAGHFPGVGLLVGAMVTGLTALLMAALPGNIFTPLVAAVMGTAFGVIITGAFHEDGLADVFDGLGGTQDRDRALIIMKDSRVGAFGAIAVVLTLMAKVAMLALLGAVSSAWMCTGLFLAHVTSRTWPLLLIRLMPHVGDAAGSKSKPLADQISVSSLLAALAWTTFALVLVVYLHEQPTSLLVSFATALLASGLVFLVMWRWFWHRLQGFTGDCLGTTQQLCELAFYLGLALSL